MTPQAEMALETLNAHIQATETYETQHEDAGDAYTHLPKEGGWSNTNGDGRLRDWILTIGPEHSLVDLTDAKEFVLDNMSITPGHRFSSVETDSERFVVDTFPVGEMEIQIPEEILADLTTEERDWVLKRCDAVVNDTNSEPVLAYLDTDATWIASITREEMLEHLQQQDEDA